MANVVTKAAIELPASVSGEIWSKTQETSAVMRLARPISLPGNGLTIPVITGDPSAQWVGEGASKPVSTGTLGVKQMRAYKMAVIVPFSDEFRSDDAALYREMTSRIPAVLSQKFDRTVFGFEPAPGDGFDTLSGAREVGIGVAGSKLYDAFVDLDATLSSNASELNGYALSPRGRALVLKAKDSNGRPLFTSSTGDSNVDAILGVPTYRSRAAYNEGEPNVVGFAGDWSGARYGVVSGISTSMSDQATLSVADGDNTTTINLWQQNMFALRVEFRVGFVVRDIADFAKLTDAAA